MRQDSSFSCVDRSFKVYPDLGTKIYVKETNNPKFGDYQFDLCFQLSRQLATKSNIKVPVGEIVENILNKLERIPLVEKVFGSFYLIIHIEKTFKFTVVNAYINVFISKEHLGSRLAEIFTKVINKKIFSFDLS